MLVSRKIQHTAELDCFSSCFRSRHYFTERSGFEPGAHGGLLASEGQTFSAGTALLLSFMSFQEGRLIAEPRICVKTSPIRSISPISSRGIRRINASIGRHPQRRANGHGTAGINLFIELGNFPPAIRIG